MAHTVTGTYKDGVIRPLKPLELPNGAVLEVEIKSLGGAAPAQENESLKQAMERRSRFLATLRAYADKYPEVFKDLRFTREELHERR